MYIMKTMLSFLSNFFVDSMRNTKVIWKVSNVRPHDKNKDPVSVVLANLPSEPVAKSLGEWTLFGRGEKVDVYLHDMLSSRKHANIRVTKDQRNRARPRFVVEMENVSDRKAFKVNGNREVLPGTIYELQNNDQVSIGAFTFLIEIVPGDARSVGYEIKFLITVPSANVSNPIGGNFIYSRDEQNPPVSFHPGRMPYQPFPNPSFSGNHQRQFQPGVDHYQQMNGPGQPGFVPQQPGYLQQQPAFEQQQVAFVQQPGLAQHQPGFLQQQAGYGQHQPGFVQQQAGYVQPGYGQPGYGQPESLPQQPGFAQHQPGFGPYQSTQPHFARPPQLLYDARSGQWVQIMPGAQQSRVPVSEMAGMDISRRPRMPQENDESYSVQSQEAFPVKETKSPKDK